MGTTVVGLASQAFGSINIGVSAIVFLSLQEHCFYENRAQWIGKYEKSGEHYHGTADVP